MIMVREKRWLYRKVRHVHRRGPVDGRPYRQRHTAVSPPVRRPVRPTACPDRPALRYKDPAGRRRGYSRGSGFGITSRETQWTRTEGRAHRSLRHARPGYVTLAVTT